MGASLPIWGPTCPDLLSAMRVLQCHCVLSHTLHQALLDYSTLERRVEVKFLTKKKNPLYTQPPFQSTTLEEEPGA